MKKKPKRNITWAVTAVVLAGGGLYAYRHFSGNGDEKVSYATQPVERGRVVASVTAIGTLSPLNTVQVGSQVSGRILELNADFNSEVKKGQVIAKIDPSIIQSNVAKARANLQSSRANVTKANASLEDAKQKYERAKALAERKLVAQAEVDSALASYKSARAQLTSSQADHAQSKAALDQAKVSLDYTTIYSPIDGTVISRDVDVGQTVAASLQAPTLFTIAEDLRKMELHTSVAESDVGLLAPEMDVTFTVDAFPDEQFRGLVKQIRNSPQTVQNVVTYNAVVKVENDELKLRPGMTANVTFIVARRRDVIVVPNAALRFTPTEKVLAQLSEEERAIASPPRGRRGKRPPGAAAGSASGREGKPAVATKPATKPREGSDGKAEAGKGEGEGKPGKGEPGKGEPGKDGPGKDEVAEKATSGRGPRSGSAGGEAAENKKVVWVMGEDMLPHPVAVEIGITDGSVTEITAGELAEGAEIITGVSSGKAQAGEKPAGGGVRGRRGGGFL